MNRPCDLAILCPGNGNPVVGFQSMDATPAEPLPSERATCPAIPCGNVFPPNLSTACPDANYATGTITQCAVVGQYAEVWLRAPGFGPWTWSIGVLPAGLSSAIDYPCEGVVSITGQFAAAGFYTVSLGSTDTAGNFTPATLVFSVKDSGTCVPGSQVPVPPISPAEMITLSGVAGNTLAKLLWTAYPGAVTYTMLRVNPNSTVTVTQGLTGTSFTDNGLTNGHAYVYGVFAVLGSGVSPASNSVSLTPWVLTPPPIPPTPPTPTAPTDAPVWLSVVSGDGTADLYWSGVARASYYTLSRTNPDTSITVFSPINTTSYHDSGLSDGSTYVYAVKGVNSVGNGPSSAPAWANPTGVAPTLVGPIPSSQTVAAGSPAQFTIEPSGTAPFGYQWWYGHVGTPVGYPTDNDQTLVIPSATLGYDDGNYLVTVTNVAGFAVSGIASLTVSATGTAPAITSQPAGANALVGSTVTFYVVASGSPTLTYQWKFNGGTIIGATGSSYTIPSAALIDAGNYTVTVTNSHGSVTSDIAVLTVVTANVWASCTAEKWGYGTPGGTYINQLGVTPLPLINPTGGYPNVYALPSSNVNGFTTYPERVTQSPGIYNAAWFDFHFFYTGASWKLQQQAQLQCVQLLNNSSYTYFDIYYADPPYTSYTQILTQHMNTGPLSTSIIRVDQVTFPAVGVKRKVVFHYEWWVAPSEPVDQEITMQAYLSFITNPSSITPT
jgi:hypothetical protein